MDRLDRLHGGAEDLLAFEIAFGQRLSVQPPRDETPQVGEIGHHLRADAGRRRSPGRLLLGGPIDPEEVRVLPGEPKEERLAIGFDPEVPVRPSFLDSPQPEGPVVPARYRVDRGDHLVVDGVVRNHGRER